MRIQSIIRSFLVVIVLGWGRFTANTVSAGESLQKTASAKTSLIRSIPLPVKEMRSAGSYQAGVITVSDVTSISNGSFNAGDVINIQVHLSATVIVNGTPRLRLTTNEPLTTAVDYTGPTDPLTTNILTFTYTVVPGDTSSDLDYASSAALELIGSTITGLSAETVDLALPAPGTPNSLGANNAIIIDTTAPILTFDLQTGSDTGNNTGDDLTRATTLIFDARFSEAVSGFGAPPLTRSGSASGCDISVGTASDNIYPVTVTNCGEGDLTLSLNTSLVQDPAGNPVGLTIGPTVTIDRTGPSVTLSAPLQDPVNAAILISVTVGESVASFNSGNIIPFHASVSGFEGTGSSYTFTLTPTIEGSFDVYILAGAATDAAGNSSQVSNTLSRIYDATRPSVSFNLQDDSDSGISNSDDLTNSPALVVDAIITETTTGISADDFINVGTAPNCGFSVGSGSGNRYPITVSGCLQGTLIVQLHADRLTDSAGNKNIQLNSGTITIDRTSSSVVLATGTTSPTKNAAIIVTVTFGESTNDFSALDITPTNASVSPLTGSGMSYSFTLTATSQGDFGAQVLEGKATDPAGNPNAASNTLSLTYDSTGPDVSLASTASTPTKTATIPVTVTFTEPVGDFTAGDISTANSTVGPLSGSGDTYTFNLTATNPGPFTTYIAAGVAQDAAGNLNTVSNTLSYIYDNTSPTPTLASTAPNFTRTSPIPYTITFSEPVTDFTAASLRLVNATVTGFSGSEASYSFGLTPVGQGLVSASIDANQVHDAAGNGNPVAAPVSRTYDTIGPTVDVTSTSSDPTNLDPFQVTVKFSEPVTGFLEGEMMVTQGSVTNFGGIDDTYNFNLRVNGQGKTATVFVPAGVAVDAAGNGNSDSNLFSRTFDSAAPTVTINQKTGQADPTNSSPIQFTVVFSETTTDFTAADVSVSSTAGAITKSIEGSDTTYTVIVTGMTISGTVTATIPAGAAHDAAGNASAASTSTDNTVTYDIAPPVFSAVAPATGVIINNISTASDVSYSLNEALASGSITIAWESGNSDGGAPYTCTLVGTALNTGAHSAFDMTNTTNGCAAAPALKTGAVYSFAFHGTDLAGNTASTVTHTGILFDNTAPTVSLTLRPASDTGISPTDNITNAAALIFNAAFSEPISGLVNTDFTFTGTSTGCTFSIGVADVNTYPVTASNCTPGLMTIRMIASSVTDLAGNPILQTDGTQITIDRAGPTVTLSSTSPAVTNTSPIPVTVAFTEPVTGLLAAELSLTNGTIGEFSGSGASYTFNLYPSATGTVTVAIPGASATDTAGNPNSASLVFSREYDTVAPTVTMTSSAPAITKTSPIPVTVTFSESVTGFSAGEIVPTNATVSGFSGSGTTYSFNLIPNGLPTILEDVKADIAAGVAQDTAGNWNTAAATFSRTFDTVVPTVTFNLQDSSDTGILPTDNVTNAPTLVFDAIFSETVNGFTPAKLSNGGTATGCVYAIGSPTGNTYPVTVTSCTAVSPSKTLILRLGAGGVTDLALNSNGLTNGPTVTIDRTVPGLTFDLADASDTGSSAADNITNALSPIVSASFTEPIYGIDLTDFTNSGTAGPCAIAVGPPTGNIYPLTFSACIEGTLVPLLTAGLITDAAGNAIGQTDGLTIQIDRTSPVTTMASAITDPTSSPSIPVTVSFTEPVVNFIQADIISVNGTVTNFSGTGAAYSFNLLPSAQGLVSASIAIGVTTDTAGNGNTAASFSRTYDSLLPMITMSSITNPVTNVSSIPVTVTFTEPVTGFISGDITPGNATISNFSGSGASYSFNLVPAGQGLVTASISSGVAVDSSGNGNVASLQFSRTYDSLPPLVTFDLEDLSDSGISSMDNLTNVTTMIVDAVFNEPITGLTLGDLSYTGTATGCIISIGTAIGNTVPLTVSSCSEGTIVLRLAAGGVSDTAGNVNGQTNGLPIIRDKTGPIAHWILPTTDKNFYNTYHQIVHLQVDADDINGVRMVDFIRYNWCGGNQDEMIGTDFTSPYGLDYDTSRLCGTDYSRANEIDAFVYDLAGNSTYIYIWLSDLPALTVTFPGGGFGTVSSSPAGINCTKNCSFGWSVETQLVTLTAVPSGTSLFTGWGGACTGTGTCQVTMGTLNLDRAVTATFVSTTNLYLPLIVR